MMSITVTDPALLAALIAATEGTELRHPDGHVLFQLAARNPYSLPPGVKSPFTDEEMAERRKNPGPTRKLDDILRDLEASA
jgi:hypothetical protein